MENMTFKIKVLYFMEHMFEEPLVRMSACTWGRPAPTMAPLWIMGPSFPTNRPGKHKPIHIYSHTCTCTNNSHICIYIFMCVSTHIYYTYHQRPQTGLRWSCRGKFVIVRSREFSPHLSNIWFLGFLNLQQLAGHRRHTITSLLEPTRKVFILLWWRHNDSRQPHSPQ